MPGKPLQRGTKNYLYIIGGNICQKVDENTPGAVKRDFENPTTKEKGSKWEIINKSWEGIIESIDFRSTEYGHQVNIDLGDAVLTIDTKSRYFSDFAKKIQSVNLKEPLEVYPFDFESEDKKRLIGLTLIQNGKKAKNYYWDETEKKTCHGMPVPIGNTKTYGPDDWMVFYVGVKKFFIAEIEKLGMSRADMKEKEENEEVESAPRSSKVDDDIPIIGMEKEEEIKIEDVPF